MAQPRYYAPEVPGGATRRALAWYSAAKQRAFVVAWIKDNYEQRRTDHVLFDEHDTWAVADEAHDEFDDVIPDHVVEAAVEEACSQGEWVRRGTARRREIERYDVNRLAELFDHVRSSGASRLGTVRELQERAALATAIQTLTAKIDEIQVHLGMHSSNGGPPDLETPKGQFAAIREGVGKLSDILRAGSPDLPSATQTAYGIESIARENGWLKTEIEEGCSAYIRAFCETSGKDHAHVLTALLSSFVVLVYGMLIHFIAWLEVVAP